MGVSVEAPVVLSPHAIKRRLEIGRLLVRYGRRDLVQVVGLDEGALREETGQITGSDPDDFARDLEKMGTTFVKAGQLLSTRPDLLAQPYIDSLARLQDNVEQFSFGEVERIVEEELGVRISRAFSSFDATPIGAASVSQVHPACLRDGREVVVKVQRPGIREEVLEDLEILDSLVGLAASHSDLGRRYGVDLVFDHFRRSMVRELDFTRDARNLERIKSLLAGYGELVVPAPIRDYSTSRLLTM